MSDPRKFKNDIVVEGDIQLPSETANRAVIIDGSGEIASSTVTTTELELLSGATVDLADLEQDVADLVTLSGVAANSTDLGTFTGTIIPDSSDIKEALQSLETFAESDAQDLADHIADATDAHDASAISVVPTGNLTADDVQEALEELQSDIDALEALDPMEYKGNWDASTNTPTLADGVGDNGDLYRTSVAGTVDFGSGPITFAIGDKVVYNGALGVWEKWDTQDEVTSVNGETGDVVLDSDDIAEGVTNLYFTEERAQDAVGTILTDSDTIDFTYDDGTPEISAEVISQNSIESATGGIQLVGDEASPGNLQYYGTDGSGTKGFHSLPSFGSAGDITETSFSITNDQGTPANITGFAFAQNEVRSFSALVSVEIDATSDLFEQFTLQGINKDSSFNMSVDSVGDNSGIVFSITSAGQVQYTSGDVPGFTTGAIKFRAITTTV